LQNDVIPSILSSCIRLDPHTLMVYVFYGRWEG
jgi:hypothetical protein